MFWNVVKFMFFRVVYGFFLGMEGFFINLLILKYCEGVGYEKEELFEYLVLEMFFFKIIFCVMWVV